MLEQEKVSGGGVNEVFGKLPIKTFNRFTKYIFKVNHKNTRMTSNLSILVSLFINVEHIWHINPAFINFKYTITRDYPVSNNQYPTNENMFNINNIGNITCSTESCSKCTKTTS